MKSFKTLEQLMAPERFKTLCTSLAIFLAVCAFFGILQSLGTMGHGDPILALLVLFMSLALPLAVWLVVWQLTFGERASRTEDQISSIASSVEAISKTLKEMQGSRIEPAKSVEPAKSAKPDKPAKPTRKRPASGSGDSSA